jgi:hypothetical protein
VNKSPAFFFFLQRGIFRFPQSEQLTHKKEKKKNEERRKKGLNNSPAPASRLICSDRAAEEHFPCALECSSAFVEVAAHPVHHNREKFFCIRHFFVGEEGSTALLVPACVISNRVRERTDRCFRFY